MPALRRVGIEGLLQDAVGAAVGAVVVAPDVAARGHEVELRPEVRVGRLELAAVDRAHRDHVRAGRPGS